MSVFIKPEERNKGKLTMLRPLHQTADTANVDHSPRPVRVPLRAGLQQWQKRRGHKVNARDIGLVRIRPVFLGHVLILKQIVLHLLRRLRLCRNRRAAHTGIVDEDAQALFPRGDFLVQTGDLFLLGDVPLDGDDLALNVLVVDLDYLVELLFGAADDVDFGTVCREGLGGHETDSGTAARDEGDAAFEVEKGVAVEVIVRRGGNALRHFGEVTKGLLLGGVE